MMSELSLSYQRAHHRAMEKVRVRLTLSAAGLGRLSAHRVRVRHMFEHTAFCSSASGRRSEMQIIGACPAVTRCRAYKESKRQTTATFADSTPPPPRRAVLGGSKRLASIFYALTQSDSKTSDRCTSARGTKYTTYVVTAVHDCAQ
jgi:hypothetical protein